MKNIYRYCHLHNDSLISNLNLMDPHKCYSQKCLEIETELKNKDKLFADLKIRQKLSRKLLKDIYYKNGNFIKKYNIQIYNQSGKIFDGNAYLIEESRSLTIDSITCNRIYEVKRANIDKEIMNNSKI